MLNITVTGTFATNWLAPRIGEFSIARPELAVRLDVTNRLVDLSSGEFDIAIRGVPEPAPGLICDFLVHQMFAPMATPEFIARYPVQTPADLLAVPRISPADIWWDQWFALFDDIPYESQGQAGGLTDSQVVDGAAALAGQGVAVLSPPMFTRALATGQLVQLFPQLAVDRRRYWLVYPEHKRRLAKVRAFREWLLQSLRDTFGDDPHGMLVPPPLA